MSNSQFSILQADVILSSPSAEDRVIDVSAHIVELTLFENINKPYIDARIVMMDDFGFRNNLQIQGTERLRLVVGGGESPEIPIFVKYFFFSKILDSVKGSDRAEVLSIELVEEHVYVNAVKSISRSYESNLEDMMSNIVTGELGKSVISDDFAGTAQGVRKVIVPYLSPLEAVQWLKDRATTRTGSPIYLSGDLYSDNLFLRDLETLLKRDVVNEDLPYRLSEANAMIDTDKEFLRPYFEILSYREMESENSLKLYEEGAIGSYYSNLDAGTGQVSGGHVSVRDIITELYTSEMIGTSATQSLFDPSLEIDGRLSDEYNSLFIHQVTSTNTYNQFQGYHDEAVVLDNNGDPSESKLKVKNKIIRQLLKKNVIEISMSGVSMFRGKISPGSKLRLLFLNPDVSSADRDQFKQIDTRKSGDYFLLATSHKLLDESHNVSMRLTKLNDLPKDVILK